ncbi:hypothetical protein E2C01_003430 [Portunus trituberculatus]|uniref:Uncharacterized protein n=1 Tax=Portunus trituberculatus TaxID=210409 RepID=A0A5B7CNT8_PORTR|nr:hypothetical protein [Portunus trituberculatus]
METGEPYGPLFPLYIRLGYAQTNICDSQAHIYFEWLGLNALEGYFMRKKRRCLSATLQLPIPQITSCLFPNSKMSSTTAHHPPPTSNEQVHLRMDCQVEGRHHHITVGCHNRHIVDDDGSIGTLRDNT